MIKKLLMKFTSIFIKLMQLSHTSDELIRKKVTDKEKKLITDKLSAAEKDMKIMMIKLNELLCLHILQYLIKFKFLNQILMKLSSMTVQNKIFSLSSA